MEEVKIDKRTKEYKDSQMQPPGVLNIDEAPTIDIAAPVYLRGAGLKDEVVKDIPVDNVVFDEVGLQNPPQSPENPPEKPDYSKIENNPGWSKCFKCGADLEPNEDGSRKFYKSPTPCHDCVWADYKKVKAGAMSVSEKISLDEMDVEARNKYLRKRGENGG